MKSLLTSFTINGKITVLICKYIVIRPWNHLLFDGTQVVNQEDYTKLNIPGLHSTVDFDHIFIANNHKMDQINVNKMRQTDS